MSPILFTQQSNWVVGGEDSISEFFFKIHNREHLCNMSGLAISMKICLTTRNTVTPKSGSLG